MGRPGGREARPLRAERDDLGARRRTCEKTTDPTQPRQRTCLDVYDEAIAAVRLLDVLGRISVDPSCCERGIVKSKRTKAPHLDVHRSSRLGAMSLAEHVDLSLPIARSRSSTTFHVTSLFPTELTPFPDYLTHSHPRSLPLRQTHPTCLYTHTTTTPRPRPLRPRADPPSPRATVSASPHRAKDRRGSPSPAQARPTTARREASPGLPAARAGFLRARVLVELDWREVG